MSTDPRAVVAWADVLDPARYADVWTVARLDTATARELGDSLLDVPWRDAVVAHLVADPGTLPMPLLDPDAARLASTLPALTPTGPARPMVPRVLADAGRALLGDDVAGHPAAVALLSVAAAVLWHTERDARLVRSVLDVALSVDPEHRLSRLLASAVDLGVPAPRRPDAHRRRVA